MHRSKQINTNPVHEPNWILLIISGCIKWKKSNAMASESSFAHNLFSKIQIFYVSLDFLYAYLFPAASEIQRLFVIWLILVHHLLITSLLLLALLATTFLWLSTGTCKDEMVAGRNISSIYQKARAALPAVVPCVVAQQLNRHGNIIWFQKWSFVI